jgi:hypothetical protein
MWPLPWYCRLIGSDVAIFSVYNSRRPQTVAYIVWRAYPIAGDAGESAIHRSSPFDLSKSRIPRIVVLGGDRDGIMTWPRKQSRQADAIMNQLSFPVRVAHELVFDVVEGDRFVLKAFGIQAIKLTRPNQLIFESQKGLKNHGVSLLHILSELHEG